MKDKEAVRRRMEKDAGERGYFLCPDEELLDDLLEGLAANEERYGYGACPCRIASGLRTYDADIVCPCEYRDADVNEFGMCYCCLFVSGEVRDDPSRMGPVPERRPVEAQDAAEEAAQKAARGEAPPEPAHAGPREGGRPPVWRCEVCGYLAARTGPPPVCPICKAKADRFEPFPLG